MDEKREEEAILSLSDRIRSSKSTVVLTGPGISLDAGVPGLWGGGGSLDTLPAFKYVSIRRFRENPLRIWHLLLEYEQRIFRAEPTPAHRALASMEATGFLSSIITLTVDGLHQKAGSRNVLELFGNLKFLTCLQCRSTVPRSQVNANRHPPVCTCGGLLKPDVMFDGETPSNTIVNEALGLVKRCQLLLCIGVSGSIPPVSLLAHTVASRGGRVMHLNPGVTSFPNPAITLRLPLSFHKLLNGVSTSLASG